MHTKVNDLQSARKIGRSKNPDEKKTAKNINVKTSYSEGTRATKEY